MGPAHVLRHPCLAVAMTALLCQLSLPSLWGQEILIGATADVAAEQQSTSLPVFAASTPECGLFETGWEILPTFGGQITFLSRRDSRLGLTGRWTLSPSSGRLITSAPEPYTFTVPGDADSNEIAQADHEYRLETKAINVRLDLLLDYAVTQRLRLHLGPSFGYILGVTVSRSDYITDATYRFAGGEREQPIPQQGILATQKLMIGGRAGVSYIIPLGKNVLFVPELLIRTEFTPLFQEASRFAFGPGVGFALLTRLRGGTSDRDTATDGVALADTAAIAPLRASISLHGTDELGNALPWARIRVYETMRRSLSDSTWRIERRNDPPTLLVEPDFMSAKGISEWRVLFRYRGDVIGTTSSRDETRPASIDWKIVDDPESDSGRPLVVELTVVDSSGASVTSTDQIPLRIDRLRRFVDDRGDSVVYTLYPGTHDSSGAATGNDLVLGEAIAEARKGGLIKVVRSIPRPAGMSIVDSADEAEPGVETAAIAARLRQLLGETGVATVSVITAINTAETYAYAGVPAGPEPSPSIEIIVVRER